MAFPQRPGVTLNESLTPLASVDPTGGRPSAVFVGVNLAGGPSEPTLVDSWQRFNLLYGGFAKGGDLLPFSVFEFFNNGGGQCYVIRATNANATTATKAFADGEVVPANTVAFTAKAPGSYGNAITVEVAAGATSNKVNIIVTNTVNGQSEVYNDVTLDPADPRNLVGMVNGGSSLVTAEATLPVGAFLATYNPKTVAATALAGGGDGTGTPDLVGAAQKIANIAGTFDVNLPGENNSATINALSTWAEAQGNVFLVVDGVKGAASDTASANATAQTTLATGFTASSHVAIYAPWLTASDPMGAVAGSPRVLPPGGFVLGQYARTDATRGVQKVAAGVGNNLNGVIGPRYTYAPSTLDTFNAGGINVIKTVVGAGTCVFGGRTLAKGMPDRYINIRRTLITLKDALKNLTQFAIFENNDDSLRLQVGAVCEQYLRTQWAAGMLAGSSEDEAFFVVCDETNNTPTTIAQGAVNVQVGLALQSPAEFIIFNIGQTQSGSTATA